MRSGERSDVQLERRRQLCGESLQRRDGELPRQLGTANGDDCQGDADDHVRRGADANLSRWELHGQRDHDEYRQPDANL